MLGGIQQVLRGSSILTLFAAVLVVVGCAGGPDEGAEESASGDEQQHEHEAEHDEHADKSNASVEALQQMVAQADESIDAESVVEGQRIGVTLTEPTSLYADGEQVSGTEGNTHQLRVLLREERTKRFIPGAGIQVSIQDADGNSLQEVELREAWGDYQYYGANLSMPENAQQLQVSVSPPEVGRHGDMRQILTSSVSSTFDLSGETVQGDGPAPVAEDVTIGSWASMVLGEVDTFHTAGPYKIGYVAEASEPYWLPGSANGDLEMNMADMSEDANRHLEIVLLDAETNEVVPHADVQLTVTSDGGSEPALDVRLPFLFSAFHHYGRTVQLENGTYDVTATIGRPDLATESADVFPAEESVTLSWEAGEPEAHEHGHGHGEHGDDGHKDEEAGDHGGEQGDQEEHHDEHEDDNHDDMEAHDDSGEGDGHDH